MTTTTTAKRRRTPRVAPPPSKEEVAAQVATLTAQLAEVTQARNAAILALREAGASYSEIAVAMKVVPMTARATVLKLTTA